MRKAGLAALMSLAFVVLAVPAEAHSYVSGQVVIQSPVAVFGFSYGNPYAVGPVYSDPAYCDHGPLYYYPAYGVYGHYHPGYLYTRYAAPRYVVVGPPHYVVRGHGPVYYGPPGHADYARGHGNGHGHGHGRHDH